MKQPKDRKQKVQTHSCNLSGLPERRVSKLLAVREEPHFSNEKAVRMAEAEGENALSWQSSWAVGFCWSLWFPVRTYMATSPRPDGVLWAPYFRGHCSFSWKHFILPSQSRRPQVALCACLDIIPGLPKTHSWGLRTPPLWSVSQERIGSVLCFLRSLAVGT